MAKIMVVTADCHLQPHAWVRRPEVSGDAYCSFRQIIAHCLHLGAPLVIAGDLFDKKRPDPTAVACFAQMVEKMRQASLPIYYVQGDHDIDDLPWPSAVSPYPIHLHEKTVNVSGFNMYGLDYQHRDKLQEKLANVPTDTDFLITHQGWDEFQGIGSTEGSLTDVRFVPHLFTGDYHAHRVQDVPLPGRVLHAYSPGSTCLQALGEPHHKAFFIVSYDEDTGAIRVDSHPLVARYYFNHDIDDERGLQVFCDVNWESFLPAPHYLQTFPELAKPIVRVRYRDSIPDCLKRVTAALGDKFHLFAEPVHTVETVPVEMEDAPAGSFDSLLDACRRLEEDDTVYNAARRLLLTDDSAVAAELETMRQEFMNATEEPQPAGVVPVPGPPA